MPDRDPLWPKLAFMGMVLALIGTFWVACVLPVPMTDEEPLTLGVQDVEYHALETGHIVVLEPGRAPRCVAPDCEADPCPEQDHWQETRK